MKKIFIAILLAIIVGCSWQINPTHKYQIAIDLSQFNGEQAATIMDAANDWQLATGNYIMFFSSINYQPIWTDQTDNVINVTGKPAKQIESENGGAVGFCTWDGKNVILATDVDLHFLKRLSLHEFGHAIGLQHTGPGTIMYPWIACDDANDDCVNQKITCTDVSQLCFVWDKINCDAPDMPACQFQSDAAPPEPTFPPEKPTSPNKYELVTKPIEIKKAK